MTTQILQEDKTRIADLVRAASLGDRDAFGQLFEAFEGTVFAISMRRLNDYAEAQELTQDVFIKAMEKIAQLREPECFGAWLRQITHRMAINRIVRRGPVRPAEPVTLESHCVDTSTPLSAALKTEAASEVRAGLNRLGDMDRETLEAFYVRGQSLREMSDEFEAPVGTIKRRLHVARKRLAQQVESPVAV